jgi:hypothetical protein
MRPTGVDVSGGMQFEGRTAEEAVARARAALGASSALRCWKTRRGGVGGFFAREVFVASLTPPPGSEATRGRAARAEPGQANGAPDGTPASGGRTAPARAAEDGAHPVEPAGAVRQAFPDPSGDPEDLLAGLVEATSDQVSLRSLPIEADAFDQVLAEAQAALASAPEGGGAPPPPPPVSLPHSSAIEPAALRPPQPAEPDDGRTQARQDDRASATTSRRPQSPNGAEPTPAKKASRPKPKAGRRPPAARSTPAAERAQRGGPARPPDLRRALRELGVPTSYLPGGPRPSLDQVATVLGTLPPPPALPTRTGAVVAVVGSDEHLDRTVDVVATVLSLAPRNVLQPGRNPHPGPHATADAVADEAARLLRQIARRRAGGRTSLVAVQARPGPRLPGEVLGLLEGAAPDYVLAAVGAQCKRVDVEHWIGGLATVDALALWDVAGTRTPGELLGVHPIAFLDGKASSSLGWTLALVGRAMDCGR